MALSAKNRSRGGPFHPEVLGRFTRLLLELPFFLGPLLVFLPAYNQYLLPKSVLLALCAAPLLFLELGGKEPPSSSPLSLALLVFCATQCLASLPWTSLAWRTSLLGQYDLFSGLSNLAVYMAWFFVWARRLDGEGVARILRFNSLAAVLSSLYALAQYSGLDFLVWENPYYTPDRTSAAMANPNLLAGYLAVSIPLFLCGLMGQKAGAKPMPPSHLWKVSVTALAGLSLLALDTDRVATALSLTGALRSICMVLGLALLPAGLLKLGMGGGKPARLIGLAILVLGLLATGSRGGLLGAFVGLGLWILMTRKGTNPAGVLNLKNITFPKAAIGLFLLACAVLVVFQGRAFFGRLGETLLHPGESLSESRFILWGPAVEMAADHPLTGVGVDAFKTAFPRYCGTGLDGVFSSAFTPNNHLLQAAASSGVPGLAAYLALVGAFFYLGWRAWRESPAQDRPVLAAVLAAGAAYQVRCLFNFTAAPLDFLWFFLLAVVHGRSTAKAAISRGFLSTARGLFRKAVLVSFALFVLVFFPARLGADVAFSQGRAIQAFLGPREGSAPGRALEKYSRAETAYFGRAVRLIPWETEYRVYLGLAFSQMARLDRDHAGEWTEKGLDCYRQACALSPANANNLHLLGTAYASLGGPGASSAEEAFAGAVSLAPGNPAYLLDWSLALARLGREDDAEIPERQAFGVDSGFASKYMAQDALAEYRRGEKAAALRDLDEDGKMAPASAQVPYYRGLVELGEHDKGRALADFQKAAALLPGWEKDADLRDLGRLLEEARR